MNNLSFIVTLVGVIGTIIAVYYAYKNYKLSSDKNNFEQWCILQRNLKKLRFGDKISQQLLVNSISFIAGKLFSKVYLITLWGLQKDIYLFALKSIFQLEKNGYLKFSIVEQKIEIKYTYKCKNKNSIILFETAKGFRNFSWFIFIILNMYVIYIFTYYNISITPNSLYGILYFIIMSTLEVWILYKMGLS